MMQIGKKVRRNRTLKCSHMERCVCVCRVCVLRLSKVITQHTPCIEEIPISKAKNKNKQKRQPSDCLINRWWAIQTVTLYLSEMYKCLLFIQSLFIFKQIYVYIVFVF